jgi:uncharacterized protein with gpF-like domain
MYTPKFNAALKAQIQQYIDNGTLQAVDSVQMYDVLVKLYKDCSVIWAHQSALQIRRAKSRQPMGFSERIVELMKKYFGVDLLNIAQQITDTTKKIIQEVLSRATETGASFQEIVNELESPDLTRIRARLIARTETVSAANAAATINAKETSVVTGQTLRKMWIATTDSRVRHDHAEVDRHVIGIDDYFIVGGYKMQQPGDRTHGAPASEICNCRCTVGFVPVT